MTNLSPTLQKLVEGKKMQKQLIEWSEGNWSTKPLATEVHDGNLFVTAVEGSDAWRLTSYGFVHDTEHALVKDFSVGEAVEVQFVAAFDSQFDQAGVFVRGNDETWVKAGTEFADGILQLGAVVTSGMSDWSVAPVAEWSGLEICVRVSRHENCLIIRAGIAGQPMRLVRVCPFSGDLPAQAGPFTCAPTRAGLTVQFTKWQVGPADESLH